MNRKRTGSEVREPLQIYIAPDERRFLDMLSEETGLSRAEILRRGMRSFAAERAGDDGPMQKFMRAMRERRWPTDIAVAHDDHLAEAYTDRHKE
jgi:hypothetical protein